MVSERITSDGTRKHESPREIDQRICLEILRAITDVRFGSVEVVIHDSRVVQIERKEKVRFEKENRGDGR